MSLKDTSQRKFVETIEDGGILKDVYDVTVTKNQGKEDELQDEITVKVPASLEDAIESGIAETLQEKMKSKFVADKATSHRRNMVTESEKEEEKTKTKEKLQQLKEKAEALGVNLQELL